MKTCGDCGTQYSLNQFPKRKDSKDGYHQWCFKCKRARDRDYGAKYRENNPEKLKATRQAYNRSRAKLSANRKWKYGVSQEDLDLMLVKQNGLCGLCEREFSKGETFVDHDHTCCSGPRKTCGKCIRAILCRACNQGLGLLQDDPELLMKAAQYVLQHRDVLN